MEPVWITNDPKALCFQKHINTRELMFVQSPAPFNIWSLQGLVKQTVSRSNKQLKWFDLHRISFVRGRLSSPKYDRSFCVEFLQIQTGLKSLSTIIINQQMSLGDVFAVLTGLFSHFYTDTCVFRDQCDDATILLENRDFFTPWA